MAGSPCPARPCSRGCPDGGVGSAQRAGRGRAVRRAGPQREPVPCLRRAPRRPPPAQPQLRGETPRRQPRHGRCAPGAVPVGLECCAPARRGGPGLAARSRARPPCGERGGAGPGRAAAGGCRRRGAAEPRWSRGAPVAAGLIPFPPLPGRAPRGSGCEAGARTQEERPVLGENKQAKKK